MFRKSRVGQHVLAMIVGLLGMLSGQGAYAAFVSYLGGASAEAQWRIAAGTTRMEDFESSGLGTQISTLPLLGVSFQSLLGGGYPAVYQHFEPGVTPYGDKHLGNFPNGINAINQWNDMTLVVEAGVTITAIGYWNGDGQRDTMTAQVFDANGALLGSVGAFKGTFAGFVSDIPVAKMVFLGRTGDGWNHIDGLQTNAQAGGTVPEPASWSLLVLIGLAGMATRRSRRQGSEPVM